MAISYLSKAKRSALRGTALLRLDFNTEDDWRMRAVIPTVKFLLKSADKIVVVSHKGRPKSAEKKWSLKNDAAKLSRLIGRRVIFINHFRFAEINKTLKAAPKGSVFLLENLRFLKGEEANDSRFARSLASLADVYVNDAFAVSHRANASVAAITKFLPSYAGFELETEIESLSRVMRNPKRPLVVILGGAKAKDKLGVIKYFENKTQRFLLGGGPANTLLSLQGVNVKSSFRDRDAKDLGEVKRTAFQKGKLISKITLPVDYIWHKDKIWDIGPKSIECFENEIAKAGTILWSGPLSLIEQKKYAKGSIRIAQAIGRNKRAFSVAGGGETVMFLRQYNLYKNFRFISTGGGAMVEFLAGKRLPGIAALE